MDLARLKRFDKDKHDQLEQLIAWSQMMGLTGKDLVSLGGHIDRAQRASEAKSNRKLAETIKFDQVGGDGTMSNKWSLSTPKGRYTFESSSWRQIYVVSNKTKVRKKFNMEFYEVGRTNWNNRDRLQCALNIINGQIVLDF